MNMQVERSFPGKLLLFGEYAIIQGSQALAIPLHRFYASWKMKGEVTCHLDWKDLIQYVKDLSNEHKWDVNFDLWEEEVGQGLCLESTIKPGYGAGSSGSLVAAIYDRYFENQQEELHLLRRELGLLESYFHGASSGLDPLVSYLDQGILIKGKESFERVDVDLAATRLSVGLLDTGIARETSPLVKIYLKKYEEDATFVNVVDQISELNASCIQLLLDQQEEAFFAQVQKLSRLQFDRLKEMIPQEIEEIWGGLLESNEHVMKLCGAGGGGYFLLFSKNKAALEGLSHHDIIFL